MKLAGAFSLVTIAYLFNRALYQKNKPIELTKEIAISELNAYSPNQIIRTVLITPETDRALIETESGDSFVIGCVGMKFYCRQSQM